MTTAELELLTMLIGTLGMGAMGLLGLKLWFRYRVDRLKASSGDSEAMEQLTGHVEALRDEMRLVRDEVAELYERVDFAERLLTRGGANRVIEGDHERN